MNVVKIILGIIFLIDCIALTIVVLMQEGKQQGLGAIAGAAETYWGKNKGRSMEGMLVKLTKIFRQASTSDIIVNAHKINNGEEVSLDNKSMDFFFLKRYDADKIINVTLQLIKQKLPKFVNATEYDIERDFSEWNV